MAFVPKVCRRESESPVKFRVGIAYIGQLHEKL